MRIGFREIPRNISNSAKNAGYRDFWRISRYRGKPTALSLSRIVSEINGDFSRKSEFFFHPVYFLPPLNGFPLELCAGAGRQKLEW